MAFPYPIPNFPGRQRPWWAAAGDAARSMVPDQRQAEPSWWEQMARRQPRVDVAARARPAEASTGTMHAAPSMERARNFSVDLPQPEMAAPQPAPAEIAKPPVTEPGYTMAEPDLEERARSFNVPTNRPNLWERIGGALDQPGVRGTLLRNGYGLLTGGDPSAGFAWHERAGRSAEEDRRWQLGYGLQERTADREDFRAVNQVEDAVAGRDIQRGELLSSDRYRRGTVWNQAQRTAVDRRNTVDTLGMHERDSIREADVAREGNRLDYDASRYATDGSVYAAGIRGGGSEATPNRTVTRTTEGRRGTPDGYFFSGTPEVPGTRDVREYPMPGPDAINALRRNPGLQQQFDTVFGPGAAAAYLGR